ncbi:MAG TPA: hypothetical protein PKY31_17265 [Spirochaetota bacterium]|nr:hypothetical protein [Spirochaetota bacterium]
MIARALAVWLVIIAAETVHGFARGLFLAPLLGDFRARQVAVFTGMILIFCVSLAFARWLRAGGTARLLAVGILWVCLTVAFEVLVGRFAAGLDWGRIASDYDIARGGLLPVGLAFMAVSPWLAARIRKLP